MLHDVTNIFIFFRYNDTIALKRPSLRAKTRGKQKHKISTLIKESIPVEKATPGKKSSSPAQKEYSSSSNPRKSSPADKATLEKKSSPAQNEHSSSSSSRSTSPESRREGKGPKIIPRASLIPAIEAIPVLQEFYNYLSTMDGGKSVC